MAREPTPKGLAAMKRAQAAHRRAARATEARDKARLERREAIREAHAGGVTYDALAQALGVTRERVRQLLAEK